MLFETDMALSGVRSVIPVDEVIEAMDHIGRLLPCSLKETATGGLAVSETAKTITRKIYGEENLAYVTAYDRISSTVFCKIGRAHV